MAAVLDWVRIENVLLIGQIPKFIISLNNLHIQLCKHEATVICVHSVHLYLNSSHSYLVISWFVIGVIFSVLLANVGWLSKIRAV